MTTRDEMKQAILKYLRENGPTAPLTLVLDLEREASRAEVREALRDLTRDEQVGLGWDGKLKVGG